MAFWFCIVGSLAAGCLIMLTHLWRRFVCDICFLQSSMSPSRNSTSLLLLFIVSHSTVPLSAVKPSLSPSWSYTSPFRQPFSLLSHHRVGLNMAFYITCLAITLSIGPSLSGQRIVKGPYVFSTRPHSTLSTTRWNTSPLISMVVHVPSGATWMN